MTRTPRLYLTDILEALQKLQEYTANLTFEKFMANPILKDAVIKNFTVLGEAANHIPDSIQEKHPEVPWYQMRAMRNIMAHEYYRVDFVILWETIHDDLPQITPKIEKILREPL